MNYINFLPRVYDKREKKMIYLGDKVAYLTDKKEIGVFLGIHDAAIMVYNGTQIDYLLLKDRFVPMLCSGYMDKNQKLIFAGDIVAGLYDDFELAEAMGFKDGGNFKIANGLVKFEDGCFSIDKVDYSDKYEPEEFLCYMNAARDLKIIDNKWEHPELLEGKAAIEPIYTGKKADCIIIDDPIKIQDEKSK